MKVTKEDFVRCWQAAATLGEVAEITGLTLGTVKRYGWDFRRNGVPLKRLADEKRGDVDWKRLATLANQVAQQVVRE